MKKYANLVRYICQNISDERGSKCGYDLLMGIEENNAEDRYGAWVLSLKEKDSKVDTLRNGVWVPAIPIKS